MNSASPPPKPRPGPKGKVLEPYAAEILLKARQGQSMQDIVNWLAQSPRGVSITRQAVHVWVKARIRKLVKLNADFAGTGVGSPFQPASAPTSGLPPTAATPASSASLVVEGAGRSDAPAASATSREVEPKSAQPVTRVLARPKVDMTEFHVDEATLLRAQNPLVPDP